MSLLELRGLVAGYGRIDALHGVSLEVTAGEAVTLIGANGAGKSTVLKAAAGLLPARSGRVLFDGTDVTSWPAERRARAGIGLVPEGRRVFPGLSVADNLLLGRYRRARRARRDRIDTVYELFPILRQRMAQPAGTLSGGEQQMLAIGRALAGGPRLLLLDEPSLGLAPRAVAEVTGALAELTRQDVTLVLVEQNAQAAFQVARSGWLLDRGRLRLSGTTAELAADDRVRAAYLGAELEA